MPRFRCYRCPRRDTVIPGEFHHFESDDRLQPSCPQCGAGPPAVVELNDVHFLIAEPRGQIRGSDGLRYRQACDPGRDHLAEARPPGLEDTYSATADPRAVTCPSCRGVEEWKLMMKGWANVKRTEEALRAAQMLRDHEEGRCC